MPFVLSFREGSGPLRKPMRDGSVVAMRVNGSTCCATLRMPVGARTAWILLRDDVPNNFELGKCVFLREGGVWTEASHTKARVYELAAPELWSRIVDCHELELPQQQEIGPRGHATERSFLFRWAEMSDAARKQLVAALKLDRPRQQRRPRPYPPPAQRPPAQPRPQPRPQPPPAPTAASPLPSTGAARAHPPVVGSPAGIDCPICFEPNRTPHAFGCGHLVCGECLPTVVGAGKCVICRVVWRVPPIRIFL
jgi:hypothetical protein